MGYLTGGPQRYTGRQMDVAHLHLGISPHEWKKFMRIAKDVLEGVPASHGVRHKLIDIIGGFQQQCVLPRGQRPPADPGPAQPPATTKGTAYFRLGGVYPIAHFADVLVEKLIARYSPVQLRFDPIDAPNAERHPPALKYVLTELLCNATGGRSWSPPRASTKPSSACPPISGQPF